MLTNGKETCRSTFYIAKRRPAVCANRTILSPQREELVKQLKTDLLEDAYTAIWYGESIVAHVYQAGSPAQSVDLHTYISYRNVMGYDITFDGEDAVLHKNGQKLGHLHEQAGVCEAMCDFLFELVGQEENLHFTLVLDENRLADAVPTLLHPSREEDITSEAIERLFGTEGLEYGFNQCG